MTEPEARGLDFGRTIRCTAGAASLAAAVLHVSAAVDHGDHAWQAGAFWLAAAFQACWGLAVLGRRASSLVLGAGAVANAGFVVMWFLSRTSGLAFMPGAGHEGAEPVGGKDVTCVLLEGALIGAVCLFLFLPEMSRRLVLPAGRLVLSGSVAVAMLALGVGMLDLGAESGHTHEAGLFGPVHAPGEEDDGHPHTAAQLAAHAVDREHAGVAHTHTGGEPAAHGTTAGPATAAHTHSSTGADGHRHGAVLGSAQTTAGHGHDDPSHVHDPAHHHDPAGGGHAGHEHPPASGEPPHEHAPGHDHEEPEPFPNDAVARLFEALGVKPPG